MDKSKIFGKRAFNFNFTTLLILFCLKTICYEAFNIETYETSDLVLLSEIFIMIKLKSRFSRNSFDLHIYFYCLICLNISLDPAKH